MEHVENLPKILPVWHDYWSSLSFNRHNYQPKFVKNGFPDFGGSGVDVLSGNEGFKFSTAKYSPDKVLYGAHVCSLPIFPPKKVYLKSDPCMAAIHASNHEAKTFHITMSGLKSSFYNKGGRKIHRKVSSLYSTIKDLHKNVDRNPEEEFFVPNSILNMAATQSYHFQDANFNYLGGCLVSSKMVDGNPVLLHPTGTSLNKLGITPLAENYSPNNCFQTTSPMCRTKKLKKTCIQKIRSNFAGHCFVQQDVFCSYINFTNSSDICIYELNREHGNFANIQTSPYSPVDFLSTDETGVLEVFDVESWKTSWCSGESQDLKSSSNPLLKDCSFGSHPMSVLLLTENWLNIHDLRTKNQSGSLLFSKHFSNFPWEKFVTIKCLPSCNPFQSLISSSNHLYIIDERYPEKPVLIWNHILRSIPLYCDVACVESNNVLSDAIALLGSQESAETGLFSIRFPDCQFQPVSLSNPLYPSVTTDFCDSLMLHGVLVSDSLKTRVKNPLAGVSILPHSKKKGFTCFQISSYGDIFYQDFSEVFQSDRELTYKVGTGCILSPPSKISPHISSWTDYFSKTTNDSYFAKKPSDDRIVNLTEFLEKTSSISLGCNFCAFNAYSRNRKIVLSSCCSSCGLNIIQYNDFMAEFRILGLCSGPSEEEILELDYFDVTSLSEFDFEEGERIFKVWNSSSDEFQPYADMDTDSRKSADSCASSISSSHGNFSLFQSLAEGCKGSDQEDEPKARLNTSLESTCDFIPPSQDIRPFVGETLRTSQAKLNLTDSFGGF